MQETKCTAIIMVCVQSCWKDSVDNISALSQWALPDKAIICSKNNIPLPKPAHNFRLFCSKPLPLGTNQATTNLNSNPTNINKYPPPKISFVPFKFPMGSHQVPNMSEGKLKRPQINNNKNHPTTPTPSCCVHSGELF